MDGQDEKDFIFSGSPYLFLVTFMSMMCVKLIC